MLCDISLGWMMREANKAGLTLEPHLKDRLQPKATATLHESRRSDCRIKKQVFRPIDHGKDKVLIHRSVTQRWDADNSSRPKNLARYVRANGWPSTLVASLTSRDSGTLHTGDCP